MPVNRNGAEHEAYGVFFASKQNQSCSAWCSAAPHLQNVLGMSTMISEPIRTAASAFTQGQNINRMFDVQIVRLSRRSIVLSREAIPISSGGITQGTRWKNARKFADDDGGVFSVSSPQDLVFESERIHPRNMYVCLSPGHPGELRECASVRHGHCTPMRLLVVLYFGLHSPFGFLIRNRQFCFPFLSFSS
jgi:hypothetical protein